MKTVSTERLQTHKVTDSKRKHKPTNYNKTKIMQMTLKDFIPKKCTEDPCYNDSICFPKDLPL